MVFTAMIYPLQKKLERESEMIAYNQQVDLLNREVKTLRLNVEELKTIVKSANKECEILENEKKANKNITVKDKIDAKIKLIQEETNAKNFSCKKKLEELNTKVIIIKYNKEKIALLKKYADTYNSYSIGLLIFGIPLSIIGLIFWTISTIKTEKLRTKELRRP
ncbi:hypothetical protein [Pedobacter sp. KLB.chiD]|uniref:hypothetical protein n=1 Tax=Pedobacter sp. KLB.chiD TaxID=3387402 RepID=UPI00399BC76C